MLFRLFSPDNEAQNEKAWQLEIYFYYQSTHVGKEILQFIVLTSDFLKDLGEYKLACEVMLNLMVVHLCGFIST